MTDDQTDNRETGKRDRPVFLTQDDLQIGTYQIVAPDGTYDPGAVPDLSPTELRDLYRWMVVERTFGERMVKLQRRGELGTFASGRGQEASIVGSGYTLGPDDWLFVGRGWTAMFMQGVSMRDMILYWRGIEDASEYFARNRCMVAISIGSQIPLISGIGWGLALDGDDAVATAFFGDGATSTGTAHEALNLAGVLGVPALFFCQNNQYAISTPFEKQTRAHTLAQRALGYGMEGIRIDGNDVLAVYDAVTAARTRVSTGRPVFVESVTYRRDAHTTSDDPTRYRDEAEVDEWAERDPIARYRSFLRAEGLWDDINHEAIVEEIEEEFDEALAAANAYEERDVGEIFEHLYGETPADLRRQRTAIEELFERRPDVADHVEQRPKG